MKNCIDCNRDISYKTSNNSKRCERCKRLKYADREGISKRGFTIQRIKHKLITLYSGSCAICNWKATDELLEKNGKTYYSFGCELHHIEPANKGGAETIENLILLCPNHHKQADLGIISKEELKSYQIDPVGIVDELTLKLQGAELIDSIL